MQILPYSVEQDGDTWKFLKGPEQVKYPPPFESGHPSIINIPFTTGITFFAAGRYWEEGPWTIKFTCYTIIEILQSKCLLVSKYCTTLTNYFQVLRTEEYFLNVAYPLNGHLSKINTKSLLIEVWSNQA